MNSFTREEMRGRAEGEGSSEKKGWQEEEEEEVAIKRPKFYTEYGKKVSGAKHNYFLFSHQSQHRIMAAEGSGVGESVVEKVCVRVCGTPFSYYKLVLKYYPFRIHWNSSSPKAMSMTQCLKAEQLTTPPSMYSFHFSFIRHLNPDIVSPSLFLSLFLPLFLSLSGGCSRSDPISILSAVSLRQVARSVLSQLRAIQRVG